MKRTVAYAVLIALLDQLSKVLVCYFLTDNQIVPVIPGIFNLVNWHNTGAAWGVFQDYNMVLAIISLVTVLALYFFRHSFQIHHPGCATALGLIAGGIIGNLADRLRLHHVVDFLDFYTGRQHWPAFNVADSAICVGVGLYFISSLLAERQAKK